MSTTSASDGAVVDSAVVWRIVEEVLFPAMLLRSSAQGLMFYFRTLDEPETEYGLTASAAVDVGDLHPVDRFRIRTAPMVLGLYFAWLAWITVPVRGGMPVSIVVSYLTVNWFVLTFWDPVIGGLAALWGWL